MMMNTFNASWKNIRLDHMQFAEQELAWINELNQAVLSQLEKRLPAHIKLKVVACPTFHYETLDSDGKVYSHVGTVWSRRVRLPKTTDFAVQVESAIRQLLAIFQADPETMTAFIYTPLLPLGKETWISPDHKGPLGPNREHMSIRVSFKKKPSDEI